jgi:hypothetical protein
MACSAPLPDTSGCGGSGSRGQEGKKGNTTAQDAMPRLGRWPRQSFRDMAGNKLACHTSADRLFLPTGGAHLGIKPPTRWHAHVRDATLLHPAHLAAHLQSKVYHEQRGGWGKGHAVVLRSSDVNMEHTSSSPLFVPVGKHAGSNAEASLPCAGQPASSPRICPLCGCPTSHRPPASPAGCAALSTCLQVVWAALAVPAVAAVQPVVPVVACEAQEQATAPIPTAEHTRGGDKGQARGHARQPGWTLLRRCMPDAAGPTGGQLSLATRLAHASGLPTATPALHHSHALAAHLAGCGRRA